MRFTLILLTTLLFFGTKAVYLENIPQSEYNALKSIFLATNGNFWNWRPPVEGAQWKFPSSGMINPCQPAWQGMNCSESCTKNVSSSIIQGCHVVVLQLGRYNLTGTISPSIANLTQLYHLDLSENNIHGMIPSSIGQLTNLVILELVSLPPTATEKIPIRLSGTLPTELYNLKNLQVLDLGLNAFTGTLSPLISNWRHLLVLGLSQNRFNGSIPGEIGELQNMVVLLLELNAFSSTMPWQIGNMSSLEYLFLAENRFTGQLPSSMGNMASLEGIVLFNNSFSGPFPSEMGNLKNLWFFDADFNRFSGTLAPELSYMRRLRYAWWQGNRFHGSIPSEFGRLENCTELVLSLNHFSGSIPSELGLMTSMSSLNLVYNYLTGSIPSELGNIRVMQVGRLANLSIGNFDIDIDIDNIDIAIDISNLLGNISTSFISLSFYTYMNLGANSLTGTVPTELGLLSYLDYLLLYENSLVGPIPTQFGNFRYMRTLSLDNNYLSGTVPTELGFLTELVTLLLDVNMLTGTLPSQIASMSNLATINLQKNRMHGTIPESLGTMALLTVLSLCDNHFSGTIPNILPTMSKLQTLLLASNYFYGELESTFAPLVDSSVLNTVDLSNNNFYGALPSSVFSLQKINSISLIKNCFSGRIPDAICNSSASLSVIALDGLTAGYACNTVIFSFLHTYTSKYMEGSVPTCVFSLPGLTVLHLSGNGLTGTLPSVLPSASKIRNISLSNNRIEGTIPMAFQQSSFYLLDLANNRISGTCSGMDNFFNAVDEKDNVGRNSTIHKPQLVLNDNRLSGVVPAGFRNAEHINIVGGNFFGCRISSELPVNDPGTPTAECGSNTLDLSLIVFAAGFGIGAIFLVVVWLKKSKRSSNTVGTSKKNGSKSENGTGDIEMDTFTPDFASTSSATVCDVEVIYFISMLPEIRRISFLFAVPVICCVLLPLYLAFKYVNNSEYSTHTYQYGLTPSAAFMTGTAPASAFCVVFLTISVLIVVVFRKVNVNIRLRAEQISRVILRPQSLRISWDEIHAAYSHKSSASKDDIPEETSTKNESLVDRLKRILSRPAVANSLFVIANIIIFFVINGCFVYVILTFGQAESVIAQIFLVSFKLMWNQFVLPEVLSRINTEKPSEIQSGLTEDALASALSKGRSTTKTGQAGAYRSTAIDLNTLLVLFNSIVVPIIIVMIESFNCYYYTFESQDPINLVQYYKSCHEIAIDEKCIDFEHEISTSFVPPFIYNYGCSNALLMNYTSVYVLMYIYLGLASPILHLTIAFIGFKSPDDPPHFLDRILTSATEFSSFLANFTNVIPSSRPSTDPNLRRQDSKVPSKKFCFFSINKFLSRYFVQKYSSVDKFVCRLISDFAVLFTFGMAYPPLGLIVFVCVFIESYEWSLMMTRNAQLLRNNVFTRKDGSEENSSSYSLRCQGVINLFNRFRWVLVTLMCWFFGFILVDMSEDNLTLCLSVSGLLLFWPLILYGCEKAILKYVLGSDAQAINPTQQEAQDKEMAVFSNEMLQQQSDSKGRNTLSVSRMTTTTTCELDDVDKQIWKVTNPLNDSFN